MPTLAEMMNAQPAEKEAGILDRFFAMLQEQRQGIKNEGTI